MRSLRIASTRRFALGSATALALGMLTGWAHGEAPLTAGLDAIGVGHGETPRAIRAAAAPAMAGCPRGFEKVVLAGRLTACSAPAETACAAGQAAWLGERSCMPIGARCDAAAPEGAIVVGEGGYDTIAEAIAAAPIGAVVLVSSGEHVLPSVIDRSVTIRGTCVTETRIVSAEGGTTVSSHGVGFSSLALEGALQVAHDGGLALEGVTFEGPLGVEGDLRATTSTLDGAHGTALAARPGARLVLERVSIVAATGLALDGARASLDRVSVRADLGAAIDATRSDLDADVLVVQRASDAEAPFAIGLRDGSTLHARWLFASAAAHTGVVLAASGASATVQVARIEGGDDARVAADTSAHVAIEDALLFGAEAGGAALSASEGADVRLARIDVRRASDAAIAVDGAALDAEDVVVTRSLPSHAHAVGTAGVRVGGGGRASMRRVRIDRARERGFLATGAGSALTLAEIDVTGTRPADCATSLGGCDTPPGGDALAVRSGASATVDGARLTGSRGCGVVVGGEASHVSLAHTEVRASRIGICADGARPGAITIGEDVVELDNEQRLSRPAADRVAMR
jgi:hypothetical protein